MLPDPGLRRVELFESVLLLMFPFHVLLLVGHRIPPYVQESIGPGATANKEGT